MSTEEIIKFLADAGFEVILNEHELIKDIINNITKEILQQQLSSPDEKIFYSSNGKDYISLDKESIFIMQNNIGICKMKDSLTIIDWNNNQSINIIYLLNNNNSNAEHNNLGTIRLTMMDTENETCHIETGENEETLNNSFNLIKGIIDVEIINQDGALDNTQSENEYVKMYLQTIINCINNTDYIVSNPKFYSKLNLILLTIQEYINNIINSKYKNNNENIIAQLKERLEKLTSQAEKINTELEQCKKDIALLESTQQSSKDGDDKKKSRKK